MATRWIGLLLLLCVVPPIPGGPAGQPGVRRVSGAAPPRLDGAGDPLPPGALWRLGSHRLATGGDVNFLAFSPDGKNLTACCNDAPPSVWDPATGRQRPAPALAKLTGGIGAPLSDRLFLCVDGEGKSHVLDTQGPRILRSWNTSAVSPLAALSIDGTLLATIGDAPGVVRLEDLSGKEKRRELKMPGEEAILSLALSPDGKYIAVRTEAETVVLVSLRSGKRLRRYGNEDAADLLGFSADGGSLLTRDNAAVHVFEVDSIEPRHHLTVPDDPIQAHAWAVPGRSLATLHASGLVNYWDVSSGKIQRKLALKGAESSCLAVSTDGRWLATAAPNGRLQVWDGRTGKVTAPSLPNAPFLVAGFAADGAEVVVAESKQARRWGAHRGELRGRVRLDLADEATVALSPDGNRLAVLGASLSLIDLASGQKGPAFEAGDQEVEGLVFLPDGRHVLLHQGQPQAPIHDAVTGKCRGTLDVPLVGKLYLGDGGRTLYVAPESDDQVERWELSTGRKRGSVPVKGNEFRGVSPDGQRIVFDGAFGLLMTDRATPGRLVSMRGVAVGGPPVVFSSDGAWLLGPAAEKGDLLLFEAATGKLRARLRGHRAAVTSLCFAPSGRTFLSTSDDNVLLVWDLDEALRTGRVRAPASRPLEALWADLASDDGEVAERAIGEMSQESRGAVRFLAGRLRRAVPPAPGVLDRLIADLDGDQAAVREVAEKQLAALGDIAAPALRQAAHARSAETRRRAARLLRPVEAYPLSGERARPGRAVEALERLGTPAARRLLADLACGTPDSRLTGEARSALDRLKLRISSEP